VCLQKRPTIKIEEQKKHQSKSSSSEDDFEREIADRIEAIDNRTSNISFNRRVTFGEDQLLLDDINEQAHIDLSCVKEMKKVFISEMDDSFLKQF
jgi:hypothetical protein